MIASEKLIQKTSNCARVLKAATLKRSLTLAMDMGEMPILLQVQTVPYHLLPRSRSTRGRDPNMRIIPMAKVVLVWVNIPMVTGTTPIDSDS